MYMGFVLIALAAWVAVDALLLLLWLVLMARREPAGTGSVVPAAKATASRAGFGEPEAGELSRY